MTLVKRLVKGSALTASEHDANMDHVLDMANMAEAAAAKVMTGDERTKLTNIEAGADVTDATNVEAAGALMDSEVTNLSDVKSFDPADYATAAQGSTADTALQPGGALGTPSNGTLTNCTGLPAAGVSDASANGRSLFTAANYAAMRALLDLEAGTDFYSISAADAAALGQINIAIGGLGALAQAHYSDLGQSGSGPPTVNARYMGDTYTDDDDDSVYVVNTDNGYGNTPASDDWQLEENQTVTERRADLLVNTFQVDQVFPLPIPTNLNDLISANEKGKTITALKAQLLGGTSPTGTVTASIGSTAITGIDTESIDDTLTTLTATAANTLAQNDRVSIAVASLTGDPTHLRVSLLGTTIDEAW